MRSSTQFMSQSQVSCGICRQAVPLERCKIDEWGKAVHEECYVRKVVLPRIASPAQSPESWFNALFLLMRDPV